MTDAAARSSASTPPSTPDAFLAKLSVAESKPSEVEDPPGCTTVRRLGSGSAGTIYLMRRDDGLLCVSKRVPVSHLSHADQEKAEREVNILATLEHPHIVRYDRAFVRMGQLCIVMEHAAGGDLASHVASLRRDGGRRVAVERAAEWFVQLLLALKYVHAFKVLHRDGAITARNSLRNYSARNSQTALSSSQVLHRDVSLKNIFLFNDQNIKLGDFGVACVLDATNGLAMTKVGTPCYISPERCEGARRAIRRNPAQSAQFGAILYMQF